MEIAGIIYEMVGMSFAVIVSNVVATALLGAFFLESKKQLIVLFLVFQCVVFFGIHSFSEGGKSDILSYEAFMFITFALSSAGGIWVLNWINFPDSKYGS